MWAHFENIIWLLFIPIFIGLSVYVYAWKKSTRRKFADSELIKKLFPKTSGFRFWFKTFLITMAVFFAVLAYMDPLFGEEETTVRREGVDIVYALDLSNSMYVEDVAPNRLEKAKKIIIESMDRLGGDRVGLIVFAADAYPISPLTTDYNAIRSYVDVASPKLISYQGTSFSEVALEAAEMFENSPTTEKLLIILTDGEDNENSISKASEWAKKNKIHIVTMGFGTKSGGPIPIMTRDYEDYKTDSEGSTVISKLSEDSMKSLAKSSSGIYIYVDTIKEALDELHSFMNTLEKDFFEESVTSDKKHVFQWFLALALLFIFIDTLTSEHKVFNIRNQ